MKLAWFRTDTPRPTDPIDDTAALIAELRATRDIEVFTAANAHDFVSKHFRAPYDLTIYELDNTPAHAFIWPYLLRYSGVLLLRMPILHDSRAATLVREQRMRDYATEFAFNYGPTAGQPAERSQPHPGSWPMLRAVLLASRATVVSHVSVAELLRDQYPDAAVRVAGTGVSAAHAVPSVQQAPGVQTSPVTFGALSTGRLDIIRRSMARAREAGASAELVADSSAERLLRDADVILSLPWPWFGEPHTLALAAMAAGKPAVVLETAATADWPALDPQTWRSRGLTADAPVAVSIDPRDEEHSLAVAIRRLSSDTALRVRLGEAAHDWWRTHATPEHASQDWERILADAEHLNPPTRPADWPEHLNADGTERARVILGDFGVRVDFL